MTERRLIIEEVKNLKLQSIVVPNPHSRTVIVGNAYGIMPYIKPLALKLSESGIQPYWFAFSGQEGTPGQYSYKQCIMDLANIINHVKFKNTNDSSINFLSHCAGSLMALEYLMQRNDSDIKRIAIYGLLYALNRRRIIAERKLVNCGVQFILSEKDWAYNPLKAIKNCQAQILFCHAKDKLNLERATEAEMELAVNQKESNRIKWFEKGYDEDIQAIDSYLETYVSFLK